MRSASLLVCGLVAGCTASADEVRPAPDELFFPTGAAVSPDDRILFVANANSELRFDSGTVGVIDLEAVDQIANEWVASGTVPDRCERDPNYRETIICSEEMFMLADASARIGNFATDIAIQDTGSGTLRLIVPTRGDPSVAWLDWDGTRLNCNQGAQGFSLCDEAHRLTYVHDDPDLAGLRDEPFDAFADSAGQFAIVTHLSSGAVSLIDSPIGGTARVSDMLEGFFAADPGSGQRGATGVAGRTPSAANDIIYVASRSEDRIQMFTVGRPVNEVDPYLIPAGYFFLNLVGATSGGSSDTRSLAFSPTGDRLYLVNRRPPSLQIYDTSLSPTGVPRNVGIAATDLCRQASTLAVMDSGDGERAYVSCFQDGQLYVIDPRGLSMVEDIVSVGRGPFAVATAPSRKKVYVTNFLEDTVAVVDVSPTSLYHNRVVLRIGERRPL
jgi:DNA-binding beta-propeller fold protein YncE